MNRYLKLAYWILAIVLGALQALTATRSLSSADAISYLDIGDAYFRGDWTAAINAYWSPLYSWLLGLAMFLIRPSPAHEFAVVKAVNFLIFLFALGCFEIFLCELISRTKEKVPDWILITFGYTLFLWGSLHWNRVTVDTPDLCTAGLVYLAAAYLLKTRYERSSDHILLGIALGFGYLSKAVLFPISFVFFVATGFQRKTLLTVLSFVIVTAPFILALSFTKGRLTFSDSGKLNYAWFVNPVYPSPNHWQGGPEGFGTPVHPTRKILNDPAEYEFTATISGTYSPWYDPSYWWEGLSIQFSAAKQATVIRKNLLFYLDHSGKILAVLLLVWFCGSLRQSLLCLQQNWRLVLPAAAGLTAYMFAIDMPAVMMKLQPATRYVGPFLVLLFAVLVSCVRLPDDARRRHLLAAIAAILFLVTTAQILSELREKPADTQWQVAQKLIQMGIPGMSTVAILGDEDDHVGWARLVRARIIAQVPAEDSSWLENEEKRRQAFSALHQTGASFAIGNRTPGGENIGNTGYKLYRLTRPGL